MLKKNYVASAILLIFLIIVLIILAILNLSKISGQDIDLFEIFKQDSQTNTSKIDDVVILKQTSDAGQSYIDKLYFVGDSTTYHFFKGGIDKSHLLVPSSYTLYLESTICDVLVGDTGFTIPQAIKEYDAEYVIITIGVNGADGFSEIQYKTYYNKLLNAIKSASPNTQIIIQSVFPVAKWYSDKDNGITNDGINRLNKWLKEIAKEQNLPYLDTQSILKDDNGAMISEYDEGDGVHMNSQGYSLILEYIRTHACNKETK